MASGANHALILLERRDNAGETSMELWGCGDGSKGQLGPSYLNDVSTIGPGSTSAFRPINLPLRDHRLDEYSYRLIASSWQTTYVVLSSPNKSDVLISMGADVFGGTKRTSLHLVELGPLLPPESINLVIASISAAPQHVIAYLKCTLADSSTRNLLVGWGNSRHGQLGKGTTSLFAHPRLISLDDGEDPIAALGLGTQHSAVLRASGVVSGLGSDKKSQLRGIEGVSGATNLACTWNGTYLFIESEGGTRIMATGSHAKGQLGRPLLSNPAEVSLAPVQFPFTSSTHRMLSIACGSEHVICLFAVTSFDPGHGNARTEVWGWGWNEHGNLGVGTIHDVIRPEKIWPNNTQPSDQANAVGIWAGCGTSWIAIQRSP